MPPRPCSLLSALSLLAFPSLALVRPAPAQEVQFPTPPEAVRHEGVPVGTLTHGIHSGSEIYPGTTREYAVYVPDFSGRYIHSYQIQSDGSLAHKLPYFHAELPLDGGHSHLDGMCVNTEGNLLVATSRGIQIFDERGRILIVLPRPKFTDARTNYVAFGGPDRKTLYVATAGTVYKRPALRFQGADPMAPQAAR